VIGYRSLQSAINSLNLSATVNIEWKPFELNPQMPPEGQDRAEHIMQKYGLTPAQSAGNRQNLIDRGKEVAYDFNFTEDGRIYNTFDAHRLLHWAIEFNLQTELKLALFDLYFQQGGNPSDHDDLLHCVEQVGLDKSAASQILHSDKFEQEVRDDEQWNFQNGISAVPAFIFDNKFLISGAQPAQSFIDVFDKLALR
jgi:predicted DsbA family dithiol-disulfide isomerase